ncbi:MAG TPA: hypothetical protein VF145_00165, partial [Chitinophagaceae bacterium]
MMKTHPSYKLNEGIPFNEHDYPEITAELQGIRHHTAEMPVYFKREIIISFVKDHCIHCDWIRGNPAIAQLVISGTLPISALEALFASCRNNPGFRNGLERYMKRLLI